MRTLIISVLSVLFTSATCVAATESLTLEVAYSVHPVRHLSDDGKQAVVDYHLLKIRAVVTNIGSVSIIVPTSTYDGRPSQLLGGGHEGVGFHIGFRALGEKVLVTPAERYFPVLLEPGMSTELPSYEVKLTVPETTRKVMVTFDVDEDIARAYGWWSGSLTKAVDFSYERAEPGATDNPADAQ